MSLYGTYNHELAHAQIDIHNGCTVSEIEINLLGPSHQRCLNGTSRNEDLEYTLDSINDIVFYNLQLMYFGMVASLIILLVYLEISKGKR